MARLKKDEHQIRQRKVWFLLARYFNGIREIELAAEMGWQRRTLNAYLRLLEENEQAYKDGRLWHACQRVV